MKQTAVDWLMEQLTFCSYAKAGFKKHLPVSLHKVN